MVLTTKEASYIIVLGIVISVLPISSTSFCASGKTQLALGALNIHATSEPSSIRPPEGLRVVAAGIMFVDMVFR
jgi:hypothetical protein